MSWFKLTDEDIARRDARVPTPEGIEFDRKVCQCIEDAVNERRAAMGLAPRDPNASVSFAPTGPRPWDVPAGEDFAR